MVQRLVALTMGAAWSVMAQMPVVVPAAAGMSAARLERAASILDGEVKAGKLDAAALLVARRGNIVLEGAYGNVAGAGSAAVEKLSIGDGLKSGITTGPLINEAALDKVEEHIADVLAGRKPGVVNAPAILAELLDKSMNYVEGAGPHVVNLTLLPRPALLQHQPVTALIVGDDGCRRVAAPPKTDGPRRQETGVQVYVAIKALLGEQLCPIGGRLHVEMGQFHIVKG